MTHVPAVACGWSLGGLLRGSRALHGHPKVRAESCAVSLRPCGESQPKTQWCVLRNGAPPALRFFAAGSMGGPKVD